MRLFKNVVLGGLASLSLAFAAFADQPKPWQLNLQEAATENMSRIVQFNDFLLIIMAGISLLVLGLMLYVMIRFRAGRNPSPSKTTHNTLVEVVWTVLPILILIVIAVPSFRLLYFQRVLPEAEMTVKAVGYQWYWGYEYPDEKIAFDSLMIEDKDLKPGEPRLLATDTKIVVPVNKVVKVMITSADVNHAWAMPAFGVKRDAIPGRINETWFKAEKEGIYYGQCSELCGVKHAFMPIEVHVVSDEKYASWLIEAKQKYAMEEDKSSRLANKKIENKEKM